jgi:hypothetical protein
MRDQRGEHVAEVIEDRLGRNEDERRGRRRSERVGKIVGERQRTAHHPRTLAVVVAENGLHFLRERTLVQGAIRRDDVNLVTGGAEHAQLGVDHQDAVDIRGLRGGAEQFADGDDVGRGQRLHDVGALRDAFEPRRDAHEQRAETRAGEARFSVEPLAEFFLREATELLRLPLEALIEPDDGQSERRRERDRRGRNDRDDQPAAERRKAEQGLVPQASPIPTGRPERPPSASAPCAPWRP